MSLQIGQPAPQFTLVSSALKEVSLADFKGKKVVLHFFPAAFTGTCTTQLCTMRDNFGYYEGVNAVIFGISVDMPFTLAKFKERTITSLNYCLTLTKRHQPLTALFTKTLYSA